MVEYSNDDREFFFHAIFFRAIFHMSFFFLLIFVKIAVLMLPLLLLLPFLYEIVLEWTLVDSYHFETVGHIESFNYIYNNYLIK